MRRKPRGEPSAWGYVPKATRSKLITVATVSSRRDPSKTWTVKLNPESTVLSCDCPAWIFRPSCGDCGDTLTRVDGRFICRTHGPVGGPTEPIRTCKHIRAYQADAVAAAQAVVKAPVDRLADALRTAGDAAGVRDVLYERQWQALAVALLDRLDGIVAVGAAPVLMAAPDLVVGGLRVITLED